MAGEKAKEVVRVVLAEDENLRHLAGDADLGHTHQRRE